MSADLSNPRFHLPRGGKNGTPALKKRIPVLIRLPQYVLDHVDAAALAQLRSRSAEIQMRLEASMANESIDEHGVIVVRAPRAAK